ncbi:hypothetical protein COU76_04275 [Candidatus Peregrinibacteria bacterium CG10_big_fil_rev_8_21_14_0_10_49_10]|nr:MAG: hypothetical protein COU76_04275 [Candidatus Peregrinibacteria bacterium CG10_big_fil_rev_8_21_14_0_10_49_10]
MMPALLRKLAPTTCLTVFFLLLVAAKFLAPLVLFDLPLGYDPGIYRYLFVRHALGFPPFVLAPMDSWAYAHPLGLFFFSSILMRLGVPADWLIGWIWNAMTIVLLCALSVVTAKREGRAVGACVLLMGALSAPYYDGFSAMYWKTYLALFFMILAFHFLQRRSWWALLPAILCLVTHNQTGLLFALVTGTWWFLRMLQHWRDPRWQRATGIGLLLVLVAAIVYLPVWQEAIVPHLKKILTLRGDDAPSGSFPSPVFYLRMNAVVLFCGAYGFVRILLRDRHLSLWSLAVLWSAAFVCFRLYFYLRFFLLLDFFLLPFAAYGVVDVWKKNTHILWHAFLVLLFILQAYLSLQVFAMRTVDIDAETFQIVRSVSHVQLPEHALVMTLENKSTTWLRGWLTDYRVMGPGIFGMKWLDYDKWVEVIYGSHEERVHLLKEITRIARGPVYFLITPLFFDFYGDAAETFLQDPCFRQLSGYPLLEVTCT